MLAAALPEPELYAAFAAAGEAIAAAYEKRDTAGAMREIMALADRANQYIDSHKPWLLAKQPDKAAEVQAVCTQGLNLFRVADDLSAAGAAAHGGRGTALLPGAGVELGERLQSPCSAPPFCRTSRWPRGWIPKPWRR